ncbi:hypothetical protein HYH02_007690 [Chlamydomonas schloesseri]|uniref:Uncharacterized protein n=1 Tax=Chlamydomonas schloesseri TaxID=2026947 RepID=A0A835WH83_9CHLO|nr:hypothetical protein HYH02_007690 [Chlamydomonas schloesseri]|eukprot:KAG2447362.1 hypothetical protein HYH02_007690 [Chlamydomonas schloesseri]
MGPVGAANEAGGVSSETRVDCRLVVLCYDPAGGASGAGARRRSSAYCPGGVDTDKRSVAAAALALESGSCGSSSAVDCLALPWLDDAVLEVLAGVAADQLRQRRACGQQLSRHHQQHTNALGLEPGTLCLETRGSCSGANSPRKAPPDASPSQPKPQQDAALSGSAPHNTAAGSASSSRQRPQHQQVLQVRLHRGVMVPQLPRLAFVACCPRSTTASPAADASWKAAAAGSRRLNTPAAPESPPEPNAAVAAVEAAPAGEGAAAGSWTEQSQVRSGAGGEVDEDGAAAAAAAQLGRRAWEDRLRLTGAWLGLLLAGFIKGPAAPRKLHSAVTCDGVLLASSRAAAEVGSPASAASGAPGGSVGAASPRVGRAELLQQQRQQADAQAQQLEDELRQDVAAAVKEADWAALLAGRQPVSSTLGLQLPASRPDITTNSTFNTNTTSNSNSSNAIVRQLMSSPQHNLDFGGRASPPHPRQLMQWRRSNGVGSGGATPPSAGTVTAHSSAAPSSQQQAAHGGAGSAADYLLSFPASESDSSRVYGSPRQRTCHLAGPGSATTGGLRGRQGGGGSLTASALRSAAAVSCGGASGGGRPTSSSRPGVGGSGGVPLLKRLQSAVLSRRTAQAGERDANLAAALGSSGGGGKPHHLPPSPPAVSLGHSRLKPTRRSASATYGAAPYGGMSPMAPLHHRVQAAASSAARHTSGSATSRPSQGLEAMMTGSNGSGAAAALPMPHTAATVPFAGAWWMPNLRSLRLRSSWVNPMAGGSTGGATAISTPTAALARLDGAPPAPTGTAAARAFATRRSAAPTITEGEGEEQDNAAADAALLKTTNTINEELLFCNGTGVYSPSPGPGQSQAPGDAHRVASGGGVSDGADEDVGGPRSPPASLLDRLAAMPRNSAPAGRAPVIPATPQHHQQQHGQHPNGQPDEQQQDDEPHVKPARCESGEEGSAGTHNSSTLFSSVLHQLFSRLPGGKGGVDGGRRPSSRAGLPHSNASVILTSSHAPGFGGSVGGGGGGGGASGAPRHLRSKASLLVPTTSPQVLAGHQEDLQPQLQMHPSRLERRLSLRRGSGPNIRLSAALRSTSGGGRASGSGAPPERAAAAAAERTSLHQPPPPLPQRDSSSMRLMMRWRNSARRSSGALQVPPPAETADGQQRASQCDGPLLAPQELLLLPAATDAAAAAAGDDTGSPGEAASTASVPAALQRGKSFLFAARASMRRMKKKPQAQPQPPQQRKTPQTRPTPSAASVAMLLGPPPPPCKLLPVSKADVVAAEAAVAAAIRQRLEQQRQQERSTAGVGASQQQHQLSTPGATVEEALISPFDTAGAIRASHQRGLGLPMHDVPPERCAAAAAAVCGEVEQGRSRDDDSDAPPPAGSILGGSDTAQVAAGTRPTALMQSAAVAACRAGTPGGAGAPPLARQVDTRCSNTGKGGDGVVVEALWNWWSYDEPAEGGDAPGAAEDDGACWLNPDSLMLSAVAPAALATAASASSRSAGTSAAAGDGDAREEVVARAGAKGSDKRASLPLHLLNSTTSNMGEEALRTFLRGFSAEMGMTATTTTALAVAAAGAAASATAAAAGAADAPGEVGAENGASGGVSDSGRGLSGSSRQPLRMGSGPGALPPPLPALAAARWSALSSAPDTGSLFRTQTPTSPKGEEEDSPGGMTIRGAGSGAGSDRGPGRTSYAGQEPRAADGVGAAAAPAAAAPAAANANAADRYGRLLVQSSAWQLSHFDMHDALLLAKLGSNNQRHAQLGPVLSSRRLRVMTSSGLAAGAAGAAMSPDAAAAAAGTADSGGAAGPRGLLGSQGTLLLPQGDSGVMAAVGLTGESGLSQQGEARTRPLMGACRQAHDRVRRAPQRRASAVQALVRVIKGVGGGGGGEPGSGRGMGGNLSGDGLQQLQQHSTGDIRTGVNTPKRRASRFFQSSHVLPSDHKLASAADVAAAAAVTQRAPPGSQGDQQTATHAASAALPQAHAAPERRASRLSATGYYEVAKGASATAARHSQQHSQLSSVGPLPLVITEARPAAATAGAHPRHLNFQPEGTEELQGDSGLLLLLPPQGDGGARTTQLRGGRASLGGGGGGEPRGGSHRASASGFGAAPPRSSSPNVLASASVAATATTAAATAGARPATRALGRRLAVADGATQQQKAAADHPRGLPKRGPSGLYAIVKAAAATVFGGGAVASAPVPSSALSAATFFDDEGAEAADRLTLPSAAVEMECPPPPHPQSASLHRGSANTSMGASSPTTVSPSGDGALRAAGDADIVVTEPLLATQQLGLDEQLGMGAVGPLSPSVTAADGGGAVQGSAPSSPRCMGPVQRHAAAAAAAAAQCSPPNSRTPANGADGLLMISPHGQPRGSGRPLPPALPADAVGNVDALLPSNALTPSSAAALPAASGAPSATAAAAAGCQGDQRVGVMASGLHVEVEGPALLQQQAAARQQQPRDACANSCGSATAGSATGSGTGGATATASVMPGTTAAHMLTSSRGPPPTPHGVVARSSAVGHRSSVTVYGGLFVNSIGTNDGGGNIGWKATFDTLRGRVVPSSTSTSTFSTPLTTAPHTPVTATTDSGRLPASKSKRRRLLPGAFSLPLPWKRLSSKGRSCRQDDSRIAAVATVPPAAAAGDSSGAGASLTPRPLITAAPTPLPHVAGAATTAVAISPSDCTAAAGAPVDVDVDDAVLLLLAAGSSEDGASGGERLLLKAGASLGGPCAAAASTTTTTSRSLLAMSRLAAERSSSAPAVATHTGTGGIPAVDTASVAAGMAAPAPAAVTAGFTGGATSSVLAAASLSTSEDRALQSAPLPPAHYVDISTTTSITIRSSSSAASTAAAATSELLPPQLLSGSSGALSARGYRYHGVAVGGQGSASGSGGGGGTGASYTLGGGNAPPPLAGGASGWAAAARTPSRLGLTAPLSAGAAPAWGSSTGGGGVVLSRRLSYRALHSQHSLPSAVLLEHSASCGLETVPDSSAECNAQPCSGAHAHAGAASAALAPVAAVAPPDVDRDRLLMGLSSVHEVEGDSTPGTAVGISEGGGSGNPKGGGRMRKLLRKLRHSFTSSISTGGTSTRPPRLSSLSSLATRLQTLVRPASALTRKSQAPGAEAAAVWASSPEGGSRSSRHAGSISAHDEDEEEKDEDVDEEAEEEEEEEEDAEAGRRRSGAAEEVSHASGLLDAHYGARLPSGRGRSSTASWLHLLRRQLSRSGSSWRSSSPRGDGSPTHRHHHHHQPSSGSSLSAAAASGAATTRLTASAGRTAAAGTPAAVLRHSHTSPNLAELPEASGSSAFGPTQSTAILSAAGSVSSLTAPAAPWTPVSQQHDTPMATPAATAPTTPAERRRHSVSFGGSRILAPLAVRAAAQPQLVKRPSSGRLSRWWRLSSSSLLRKASASGSAAAAAVQQHTFSASPARSSAADSAGATMDAAAASLQQQQQIGTRRRPNRVASLPLVGRNAAAVPAEPKQAFEQQHLPSVQSARLLPALSSVGGRGQRSSGSQRPRRRLSQDEQQDLLARIAPLAASVLSGA